MGNLTEEYRRIQENINRMDQCAKHTFDGVYIKTLGAKYTCRSCGYQARLSDIGPYIRGYVAAGGDANDIWPGWRGVAGI